MLTFTALPAVAYGRGIAPSFVDAHVAKKKLDLLKLPAGFRGTDGHMCDAMPRAALCRAFLAQRRGAQKLANPANAKRRSGGLKNGLDQTPFGFGGTLYGIERDSEFLF
jgi:hypothetical protein